MRLVVVGALLSLAVNASAAGQPGLERTAPAASKSAADVKALLAEGIALHDKADFDGAIGKYRQALDLDPENPAVLYEKGFSQYSKHDLEAAQATTMRAIAAKGALRDAWVLLGNIYDDLGDSARAIETYAQGIEKHPDLFLLHFNLGATYRRQGKLALARARLENSVSLEPGHASSHLYLGRNYMEEGYRVPAILSLTRFLFLEGDTKRSSAAIEWLDEIFRAGVKEDSKNHITITMDPNAPKDEGDFSGADLAVSMAQTSQRLIPEAGGKLQGPPELDRLATVLAVVGELGEKESSKGFAAEYYVPLLADLSRRHLTAAYAALALRSIKSPPFEAWTTEHRGEMNDVLKLVAAYHWPKIRTTVPELSTPKLGATATPTPSKTN
ncbi:MAG: tetratricopeptide repeat protein [Thermoanaerobaculia bacterium]